MILRSLVLEGPRGKHRYTRMAEVFRRSIEEIQPKLNPQFATGAAPPPGRPPYKPNVTGFREKLRAWNGWVQTSTCPLILADCDMLMLNPIELPGPADIYFTRRDTEVAPINTGIVIVNPTSAARAFFETWLTVYLAMLNDFDFYIKFAPIYAGGDQAALGCVLESQHKASVEYLPCSEWNLTQSEWDDIAHDRSRFVHIKSDLRKLCLGERHRMRNPVPTPAMDQIAMLWRSYESR